jgi:lysophospholipid acyltransferase (LPLAT)-like uncharacterized protein
VTGAKRFVIGLFGAFVSKWQSTLKYDADASLEGLFRDNPEGSLLLLWHNRLFPGIGALKKIDKQGHQLHALISASRDGAQLSHFVRRLGVSPIRGSSSRRGSTAARESLRVLKNGDHVAITVDGPRGPCYQAQQGAAMLVQQTGAPVNFVGVECESCWTLNSWDRFIIPKPFSRVKVIIDQFVPSIRGDGKDERKELQMLIQERLMALTIDQHHQP